MLYLNCTAYRYVWMLYLNFIIRNN
jgi:hypothetical protein